MKKSLVIILILALLLLTGCKGTDNASLPKEINIGYLRVPNDELLAVEQGYIKEYFDSLGVKCNFIIVDSGVEANQAFASKSLDFASMGHTNGVVSLVKGLDTELVWIHELLGKVEALVVRDNINSLEDLKGKKIATTFSSTSHYILLNILKEAGLEKDVQVIDMLTQDIVAAWIRGDIDAAYTWEPSLSKCYANGGKALITSEDMVKKGFITANIALARKGFSHAYPQLISGLLANIEKGSRLYRENPEQAIKTAAKTLGLSKEEIKKQMSGTIWLSIEEEEKLMGNSQNKGSFAQVMKDTSDFLLTQRAINKSPSLEEFEKFINYSYIENAQKENLFGK